MFLTGFIISLLDDVIKLINLNLFNRLFVLLPR